MNGDSGEYTVEIEIDKKSGELTFECNCYYADEGNFCKHMVAAALEVSGTLDDHYYEDEGEEEPAAPKPQTKEPTYDWKTSYAKYGADAAPISRRKPGETVCHCHYP